MSITQNFTYPPELLPRADEDDNAEVVVIDPGTGKRIVIDPQRVDGSTGSIIVLDYPPEHP